MNTFANVIRSLYLIISGLLVIPISLWFATGFIGEDYYNEAPTFSDPIYLLPLGLWIIGFIIQFWRNLFKLGIILTSLPFIYYIATFIYFSIFF